MAINRREFLRLTVYAAPTLTVLAGCQTKKAEMPEQYACAPDLCAPQTPCPPVTCQPVQCQPWSCTPVSGCSPYRANRPIAQPPESAGRDAPQPKAPATSPGEPR